VSSVLVYQKIANLLAAVTLCTQTYSIIDRMVNALSIDSVARSIYEASRNLAVIKQQNAEDFNINEIEEDGKPYIHVITVVKKAKKEYKIYGRLPSDKDISEFIEQVNKDIKVAKTTASYAMGIVAKSLG